MVASGVIRIILGIIMDNFRSIYTWFITLAD